MTKIKVIAIESLRDKDSKTGKQLIDWITNQSLPCESDYQICKNKDELIKILYKIADSDSADSELILSLEAHGDENGLELTNGYISWFELAPLFRNINEKTAMGLTILSSACYGAYFYKTATINDKSPYFRFLGPNNSISDDKILEINKAIVNSIVCDKDLKTEIEDKNKYYTHSDVKYLLFDAVDLFKKVFINYLMIDLAPERLAQKVAAHYNEFYLLSLRTKQPIDRFQSIYITNILDKNQIESKFYEKMDTFLMTELHPSINEKAALTFDDCWIESGIDAKYDEFLKTNNII